MLGSSPSAFLVAFGESFCFFSLLLPGNLAILVGVAGCWLQAVGSAHILAARHHRRFPRSAARPAMPRPYWIESLSFKDSIPRASGRSRRIP